MKWFSEMNQFDRIVIDEKQIEENQFDFNNKWIIWIEKNFFEGMSFVKIIFILAGVTICKKFIAIHFVNKVIKLRNFMLNFYQN